MLTLHRRGSKRHRATAGTGACVIALTSTGIPTLAHAGETATPIEHVIVIIGENWSFDSLFATYKPAKKGESVLNLLSKKIVKADGSPRAELRRCASIQGVRLRKIQIRPAKNTL
ncbi:MAG: hypothetical protein ACR2KT_17675 [Methylocella sp.]|nr:MAG: hypothetical protein DLM68_03795 [Hyphomicrobiales bacterium]